MNSDEALRVIAQRLQLDEQASQEAVVDAFDRAMNFEDASSATLIKVADFLEIDYELARTMPGKPSHVVIAHILKREKAGLEALLNEVHPNSNIGNLLYDTEVEKAIDRLDAKIHQLETNPNESI